MILTKYIIKNYFSQGRLENVRLIKRDCVVIKYGLQLRLNAHEVMFYSYSFKNIAGYD